MWHILFVDDEQSILDGLRRSLRGQRRVWNMSFAPSGEKALELAATYEIDVIVTDMRMPVMDGAELLSRFSEQSPDAIRFVLSGHSDEVLITKSIPYAHQFLSKPCEVSVIIDKVTRALQYRDTMGAHSVRELIANIKSLPTLPHVYQELTEKLDSGETSVAVIGELIKKDPPMCAKLLQMVNSSFFGVGRNISDPVQAATLLGLDTLKNLVLTIGIFSQFHSMRKPPGGFSLERLYRHCLSVAKLCKAIAVAEGLDRPMVELCFLAGLLHDIGKLILIYEMPDRYEDLFKLIEEGELTIAEAECSVFGVDHGKVGAYLLSLWAIPREVVEAVAFHHDIDALPCSGFTPTVCVHVANALSMEDMGDVTVIQTPVNENYLDDCGLGERLAVWKELYQEAEGGGDD